MSTTKPRWLRLLAAGLVGALLVAVLVGPGGGQGAVAAVEPRTTTRAITVPAGAFSPAANGILYQNSGWALSTSSGPGQFQAPLFFEAPVVTVKKITLYAYDNGSSDNLCVTLSRAIPTTASYQQMGHLCSSGVNATNPRVFTLTDLSSRRVTGAYGPYLTVWLPGSYLDGYLFYAVKVTYSY